MYKQFVLSKSLRHLEQRMYIVFEDHLSDAKRIYWATKTISMLMKQEGH